MSRLAPSSFLRTAAAVLGLAAAAFAHPALAQDARCLASAAQPAPPQAQAMAAAARREHLAWGGAALDAHGRLTHAGAAEGADTRAGLLGDAPWERVLRYWSAVDGSAVDGSAVDGSAVDAAARLPDQVRFGGLRPARRHLLEQALAQAADARLAGLGAGPEQGLAAHEARALQVALARVAVIDTPWSAAFISWLAREAGLRDAAFAFSEAHADYAAAAWATTQAEQAEAAGAPSPYAMRACDLLRTPPRVGDLVCQARGHSAGLDDYATLADALRQRLHDGRALPMHCDVVTALDAQGFETIGGNVLDAVTRRRLDFAPGTRRLDPSYLPDGCAAAADAATCPDRHMSRQPWSLLLQWR